MPQIKSAAVVGAGNMGSGIVQKIATEGVPVIMLDISQESLDHGMNTIKTLLGQAQEKKILTVADAEAIVSRIQCTTSYDDIKDCDIVIEAVFENLDIKKKVFTQLDEVCKSEAILATNTSSYYVKDLAAVTKRPEQVVGLHYFFHPAKNRLVEVVPCKKTSEETRVAAWRFNNVISKTPIHSEDAPGFVVNRFFVPWVNESVRLLEEGVANLATIEAAAIKAFKIGMGPFELMNVTGVPISLHAATTLGNELGDFYAPCQRLKEQVASGDDWPLDGDVDESKFDEVASRMKGVIYLIAAALIDEGVSRLEDVDIGARVGLRWGMGPFEMMNREGVAEATQAVKIVAERYGLKVPQLIAGRQGQDFRFQFVRSKKEEGVVTITFDRPYAMNALSVEVMEQLKEEVTKANTDDSVKAIVLEGTGKAFVAGADIKFFVKHIKEDDLDRIYNFTYEGQEVFNTLDESNKFVVVKLDGLSLGGGSELVLCADAVIATPKGSLGFPETGIGIFPGLGGTQRLTKRLGPELAKWLVYSGHVLPADKAMKLKLIDKIVDASEIDQAIEDCVNEAVRQDKVVDTVPQDFELFADLFQSHKAEDFLQGRVHSDDPKLQKLIDRVKSKAPIALKVSEKLIDEGQDLDLDMGLMLELKELETIFATKDALTGLSSLGSREAPQWLGE